MQFKDAAATPLPADTGPFLLRQAHGRRVVPLCGKPVARLW